jgi:hemolysin activation/secretion protein
MDCRKKTRARWLLSAASISLAGLAHAAPPNAGQTLQNIEAARPTLPTHADPAVEIQQPRPAPTADGGIKIPVSSFSITGSKVYSAQELQPLVAEGVGPNLTLSEIEALVARITQHYRSNGFLVAYAYLPAQDIQNGKIEIAVLEGNYGAVVVRNEGVLASGKLNIAAGEAVNIAPLERNLLLLADTPGVEVKSTLRPGASVGTSDLLVEVTPGKRISGSIDLDNYGNNFTGQNRLGATVNFNNLTGYGDVLSFRGLTGGSDMNYGRISYQLPVNNDGTKIGIAYSDMAYKLGKEFSSLDANGNAQIGTLFASHPIIRSRLSNLNAQLSVDEKRIEDRIDSTDSVVKKTAQVWNLGLSGDHRDSMGGGGINSFSATLSFGTVNINSPVAKAIDDLTAKIDGHYGKLFLNALRLQSITDATSLFVSYTGQFASNNLDSSEKFSLGGAFGVRAYPNGEAPADTAQLITVELRHNLPAGFQLVGFVDTARAKLIEDRWALATADNQRNLSGAGLGLNWVHPEGFSVTAFYAHKLGHEKATSDTDHSGRFWIQAVKSL